MFKENCLVTTEQRDMNRKRAALASVVLASFCSITGLTHDEEAAITDLICDLLHLADTKDLDPLALVEQAIRHYEREILYPDD